VANLGNGPFFIYLAPGEHGQAHAPKAYADSSSSVFGIFL
jgi:hypothetical protein